MKYVLSLLLFSTFQAVGCSAFFSDGPTKYLAKNFDWGSGQGYVIKNRVGQKKFSYGLRGTNQASWTSKYGSVTFNQIGKELPYGGINEKGLVVEQLWMSESVYQDNNNQTISELEWIQFQLDNYATVDEVISNIDLLTIKPIATIHYLIADKSGNSAVIDFVNGKTVINKKQGKNQVITNEFFLNSENYFNQNATQIDPSSRTHFDRFCQIKNSLNEIELVDQNQAFEILNNSAESNDNYKTYWSIVYDLTNLTVYFKSFENDAIKHFRLAEINFEETSEIEASDINRDNFSLEVYNAEMNEMLFKKAMRMMQIKLDESQATAHQMAPENNTIDYLYQDNYVDVSITFITKSTVGSIYYTFINSEKNYKEKKGTKSGILTVKGTETKKVMYAMPRGEYALACFQDTNLDEKLDTKIFGIPKNYGFSNNKRGFFGTPPNYDEAKINFQEDMQIVVKIK